MVNDPRIDPDTVEMNNPISGLTPSSKEQGGIKQQFWDLGNQVQIPQPLPRHSPQNQQKRLSSTEELHCMNSELILRLEEAGKVDYSKLLSLDIYSNEMMECSESSKDASKNEN